jgi:thiamine-monophosphate kinase
MLIKKLGEFGLIERFRKSIKTGSSVIRGSGDDCAVLKLDKYNYQLATSDMLVEGIDFSPREKPFLIGRKSLAASISDIAACAGIPRYCLISMGIPKKTTVEFIDKVFKGMLEMARIYKINIIGGDLSEAGQLVIDVSMLGIVEKKYLALRRGAKTGDIIFVTGTFGGSILGRHLRFIPRLKEARFLVKNFKINSMIDVSDGLAQDLNHILKQSGVGAIIYEALIPISKQARNLDDALYSGEDFQLLFSLPRPEAKKILARNLDIFSPIGKIVGKEFGLRLVDRRNKEKIINPKGFRHF